MTTSQFLSSLKRTCNVNLRLLMVLFFLLSALNFQVESASAAPAGTALQFDGTNDYVTFGDTRLVSGTLTGTPTWNTTANSRLGDSSLTFNGSSQYVTFGAAPSLNTTYFTLETWFYMTGTGATTSTGTGGVTAVPLVSKGRGESETTGLNVNYFLGIAGSSPYYLAADFEAYAGGANYPVTATTTAITQNAWHHAAVTYDGCWNLYLDGVSQAFTGTTCPGVAPDYTSTQHAALATALTSSGVAQGYFAGRLDEARIWNYARSQAEITGSMNSESLTPANGLLASWSLNDGSGTTAANINRLGVTSFTLESWVYRNAGGATMSTGTNGFDGGGSRPAGLYPVLMKGRGEAETPANVNTNFAMGVTANGFLGADFEDTYNGGNHPAWGTTPIPTGTWTHLSATYTGTCWALFVNGVPDTLNTLATACPSFTPEASSYQQAALSAGINTNGAVDVGYFSGIIDEARIWNYARSQAEISANLYQELTSGTGLMARWGLNEGTGTTTASSVGSFPGTLTAGPTWVAGFEIPTTEPPAAPTSLSTTPSGTQINLGWTDNSTNETGFQIERSTTGSGGPFSLLITTAANAVSYVNSGLDPSSQYCYRVRAVNIIGNSAYTDVVCAMTAAEPAFALQFDGSNDYVTFGTALALNATNFTLETWFYWTGGGVTMTTSGTQGLPSVYPLVAKGRGEADGSNVDTNYFLGIDSATGALAVDFEDMASGMNHPYISSLPVTTNTWHHAAVTYDSVSAVYTVYLDGVIAGTSDLGSNVIPRYDSIQHASIATALTSTGAAAGYFQGTMDEVRIWNVVRSQAEIRSTINTGITSGTGLLGRWGMLEGSGTTIASSVGTIPGTLTNGPTWITPGAPFNLTFDTIPPAAPTLLTAIGASGSVTLDWSDNVETDLYGYNIYRSLTSGGPYSRVNSILVAPSTYADSGLTNGTEYFYVVRAIDRSGNESGNSNETYAIPNIDLGSALSLTSAGGTYATFGDPAKLDLATFTIETWFMRTGAGTTSTTGSSGITNALPLVTHGSPQEEGGTIDANWVLVINDDTDTIAADFEDNATGLNHPVSGITPIVNGVWYHAAATYDGTTWRLYLNGNLETTLAVGAFSPRSDTTQHAALGTMLETDGTSTNGFFQGTLDEARVWNRALSQAELLATINEQITSGSGLVARWGMNEGSGTVVGDSIVPAANGTIINTNYAWVPGAPFNLALAPNTPTLVSPADLATGVPTSTPLTVHVTDAHPSDLTVSFYGRIKNGPPGTDFTLIAIPDPQYYAASYPSIYNTQMDWVTANRTNSNIVFVGSLGDNVDVSSNTTQWTNAQNAWNRLLTNNVPYGLVAGNHDGAPASTANFNTYIGSQVATQAAYQGRYGTTDYDNTYFFFSGGGMDFIAIFIEYDDTMTSTSHSVLVWANGILGANPDRRAIVFTHNLLNGNSFSTQGQTIYNALRANSNLFLMLGGHLDIAGQRSDIYNGNTVYSLRSDYQNQLSQQSGYMRIMRFSPADDTIYVTTESPLSGVPDLTDTANQFSLPYAMGGGDLFELIGTTTVPTGSDATVTWSGLTAGIEYEWYAVSTNTAGSTASPTWSFTTSGTTNQAPTDLTLTPTSIAENQPSGTTVGALTSTDPDAGNTFTYTLVSGSGSEDNGSFTISGSNLLTAVAFDFETKSSYSVRIRTTDQGGLFYEEAVTITVTNVNEAPTINEGASTPVTMSEDGSPTPFNLTLHATDVDAGTTLTWSIASPASHGTAKRLRHGDFGERRLQPNRQLQWLGCFHRPGL